MVAVALICIAASALMSNLLSHRQVDDFVRRFRTGTSSYLKTPMTPDDIPVFPRLPLQPPPLPRGPRNWNLSFFLAGLLGVFLAFVLSLIIARRISSPLSRLTLASKSIATGHYAERVHVGGGKEVEELGDAFNTLAESLEKNEQVRKNMVADIAHELRNPLATLKGQIELLQDGKIDVSPDVVDSLAEDTELLSCLVEDLRQLSIAEAGQMELELSSAGASEMLEDASSRFENEASGKGLTLSVEAAPDLPMVMVDRVRIAQVLGNLISNSLTHTPPGGKITLGAVHSGGEVVFRVRDTGTGVSEEDLPNMFERFYRADTSRTRETGGAGLGLSIARSIVNLHGGRIWVASGPGAGTTVFFALPVARTA